MQGGASAQQSITLKGVDVVAVPKRTTAPEGGGQP